MKFSKKIASERHNKYMKFKFYKSESINNVWSGKMSFLGFQAAQPPLPEPPNLHLSSFLE